VRVDDLADAAPAADAVGRSGNHIFCVIFESDAPLAEVEFPEGDKGVPLAVMVPSMGRFRDLATHLDALQDRNMRVYMSCDTHENLIGLRILSSLGIHGCAVPGTGAADWDALADLMTYALLERFPHASIEPFAYIASNYDPASRLEWGSVYFDDPKHFLHLDAEGRVALSPAEFGAGEFVARSLCEVEPPDAFPAIKQRNQAWKEYFADDHPCASCPSWRVCSGRFSERLPEDAGCRDFFLEMVEVANQYRALSDRPEEARIWQP